MNRAWGALVAAVPIAAFFACAENPTAPPEEQLQPSDAAIDGGDPNGDGGGPAEDPGIECTTAEFVDTPMPGAEVESFGATEDALFLSLVNGTALEMRKYTVKAPCVLERDKTFTYVPVNHAHVGANGVIWEAGNELGRSDTGVFSACDVDNALLAADAGAEAFIGPWVLQPAGTGGYAVYETFMGPTLIGARLAQFTASGSTCHVAPLGDAIPMPKPYAAMAIDRGGRLWAITDTGTGMPGSLEIEVRDANTGALKTSLKPDTPSYLAYDFADSLSPCDDTVCILDYEKEFVTKLGPDAKPLGSFAIISPEGKHFRPMAVASSSKGVFIAGNINAAGAADNDPSAPRILLAKTPK